MPMPTVENPGTADADLVASALNGERDAFAAIYDRYSDRIHTMCVHMLGDRDDAADVCGDVFVVAFQRLAQLRDPSRLRPWLYAICRHEIYRRTKRRRRVELVEEVNEMDRLAARDRDGHADDPDPADQLALARLVQEAAAGLDDRDRIVLELQLQGVDGADLAAALGTSVSTSYQHVHRMRERMERSLGALLVARQGREECDALDRLLVDWDGGFSVLWRKRVARHVDGCDICERRRKAVPATLLGTASAAPLAVTPTSVRERVLGATPVGGAGSTTRPGGWQRDGFPPATGESRRLGSLVVTVIVLALLGLGLWAVLRDDAANVATTDAVAATTTSSPSAATAGAATGTTSAAPTTPTTVAAVAPTAVPTTAKSIAPTTRAPAPTTTRATTATTQPTTTRSPNSTTTTSTSTTTTTVAPPTLRLSGPATVYPRASNGGICANESFLATITSGSSTSVILRWSAGAATGSVPMTRDRRTRNRWVGTVDLPYGTPGPVTVTAAASATGSTAGTSNVVTAIVAPCPVIG